MNKKTVLITGGAGTLGQAFARRLYKDYNVIVIDNSEWALAAMTLPVKKLLMDFSEWRFCDEPADYVIHCAAYKHVNLGEENVEAFIENNIQKTAALFREAYYGSSDVLFISTDKAVEPISLYGVTKFVGERLARTFNFSVARLGNILSSSGSVIPLWEEKIAKGEPIPITDERMVRYWIEDYEAVDQIWSQFLTGNRLIIPQCKKIRLLDLLTETLKRHNLTIDDVTIELIGLRPGEKLEEKLKWDAENVETAVELSDSNLGTVTTNTGLNCTDSLSWNPMGIDTWNLPSSVPSSKTTSAPSTTNDQKCVNDLNVEGSK